MLYVIECLNKPQGTLQYTTLHHSIKFTKLYTPLHTSTHPYTTLHTSTHPYPHLHTTTHLHTPTHSYTTTIPVPSFAGPRTVDRELGWPRPVSRSWRRGRYWCQREPRGCSRWAPLVWSYWAEHWPCWGAIWWGLDGGLEGV